MNSQSEFEDEVATYVEMFIKGTPPGANSDLIREKSKCLAGMIVSLARHTTFEPVTPEETKELARKVLEGTVGVPQSELNELGLDLRGLQNLRKRAG